MTTSQAERPFAERVLAWFGADEEWERPLPANHATSDARIAVMLAAAASLTMEVGRSLGALDGSPFAVWQQYVILLVGYVPLAFRRRWPIPMAVLCQAHYVVLSFLMVSIAGQPVLLVMWCVSIFTVVAWEKNRAAAAGFVAVVILYMSVWMAVLYSLGNVIDDLMREAEGYDRGLFGPLVAFVLYGVLMNAFFIAGTVIWGQGAWWSARRAAALTEQAATIAAQAEELAGRAVVDERLRIARELHDVVAHHVSVTGVQAAAARLALTKQPEMAAEALGNVEEASRSAVTEMRALLGTLRRTGASHGDDEPAGGEAARLSAPTLADLDELVGSYSAPGFAASLDVVDETVSVRATQSSRSSSPLAGAAASQGAGSAPSVDSSRGAAASLGDVTGPVGLSAYRIVQEALTNVRRHSTAKQASVVVRRLAGADRPLLEVEVTDNGSPRGGSTGTGLGQVGMRERVLAAGGTLEVGPRSVGGYRVRARLPLPATNGQPTR